MSMATVSISPRDCRNWPNRGNPDIRPSLRSGAQQAIHRVRLPRPTAVEECRQPGNGLSRPSRRRCLAATRIAGRWEKGARCTATSRGSCAARLLLSRLGVVHTAASSQRRDDRHRSLLVCDQRVQRPQPHLVSVARGGPVVDRFFAGRGQEQAVVENGRVAQGWEWTRSTCARSP